MRCGTFAVLSLALLLVVAGFPVLRSSQHADPPWSGGMTTVRVSPEPLPDLLRGTESRTVTPTSTGIDRRPAAIRPRPASMKRTEPARAPRTSMILRGTATWFSSPAGVSAAGPALRKALGPGWRGTRVRVCAMGHCVETILGDWMKADRLIDLHRPLFARLARLSRGVLSATVETIR